MQCTCIPNATFCSGTFDLSGTINSLSGQLVIDCKPEGTCSFSQSFLNRLFGASGLAMTDCSFGECVRQYVIDQAMGLVSSDPTKGDTLSGGVIAGLAVLGALLALVLVGFAVGYLRQRKARKRPLVENDDGFFGGGPRRGVGLEWMGVGYAVKGDKTGPFAGLTTAVARWWGHRRAAGERANGRLVLENVSGRLPPGGFCCILGPSGKRAFCLGFADQARLTRPLGLPCRCG